MRSVIAVPVLALVLVMASFDGARAQAPGWAAMPRSGMFFGGGVGYTFGDFGNQAVYNKGLSNTYQGGVQVATGMADGPPVELGLGKDSGVTFGAQFGYFHHFADSDWLLGVKASYNYLDRKAAVQDLIIPQFGTSTAAAASTFTGYSVTKSYSVEVSHQFTSLMFVGRSFGQGFVYAGAGPSLSQVKVDLDNVVGYATLNGALTNVSGTPQSFSSSDWRIGAAMTVGVTYFLTPSWFIDVSYLLNVPTANTAWFTSAFNNPGTPDSFTGTLIGSATADFDHTQTIMVSLNKVF